MIWLKKFLNNWLTRVFLIGFLALVWGGVFCEHPYHTNPNLKLLVGDTVYHATHNFNPVISPDKGTVYYLCVSIDTWAGFYDEQGGSIYSVKIDGSTVKAILHGKYNSLAISPDGKKLAAQSYKGEYELIPESLIIIIHLETSKVESLWISSSKPIHKIVWNNDGSYLYYQFPNAIHRIYLPDSLEEIVMAINGIAGFDLFKNDSIYLDTTIWYPEIEPTNQHFIIGTSDVFTKNFIMRNILADTLFTLPDSLSPYYLSWVGQPYWFPDGNAIVFSAAKQGGGAPGGDPCEIWILENVFEQIEE